MCCRGQCQHPLCNAAELNKTGAVGLGSTHLTHFWQCLLDCCARPLLSAVYLAFVIRLATEEQPTKLWSSWYGAIIVAGSIHSLGPGSNWQW